MSSPHTADNPNPAQAAENEQVFAVMGEFSEVDKLLAAARKVRDAGYRRWEVCSPFPVHGLDRAMGTAPTRLPWFVLACGLAGLMAGVFLCWWTNVTSFDLPYALQGYPFIVSGKPVFSLPANIPVIFETTILFSAVGAVVGMIALNRLPRLYHPVFRSERFRRVTADRFFVVIEADDPNYDEQATRRLLDDAGASNVEELME
jgi:hypothetical protein